MRIIRNISVAFVMIAVVMIVAHDLVPHYHTSIGEVICVSMSSSENHAKSVGHDHNNCGHANKRNCSEKNNAASYAGNCSETNHVALYAENCSEKNHAAPHAGDETGCDSDFLCGLSHTFLNSASLEFNLTLLCIGDEIVIPKPESKQAYSNPTVFQVPIVKERIYHSVPLRGPPSIV